jgi:hypothetical protein
MHGCIADPIEEASGGRLANEARRIDGVDSCAKDGFSVASKTIEGGCQWNCDGSDQLERPVTALNFRRSSVSTRSASSFAQSCSSFARILAIA